MRKTFKMIYFKKFLIFAVVTLMISCGENPKTEENQRKVDRLIKENDSLKKVLSNNQQTTDTLLVSNKEAEVPPVKEPVTTQKGEGKHPISLHWIGWDRPGNATLKPIDSEWFSISGSQKNKAGDYLIIEGKIKRIGEKELEFTGIIVTKVSNNNGGEPCVKQGKQTFYGKGNRTYFRLQNMENCEGGMLVDYVDIFPGTSGL
ncbi:MAG TPA: hypothetical protein VFM79_07625 [Pelobium sp.]|nr:hypothetical protein [Pelobium sp.]